MRCDLIVNSDENKFFFFRITVVKIVWKTWIVKDCCQTKFCEKNGFFILKMLKLPEII